jgi:hypothetical protein
MLLINMPNLPTSGPDPWILNQAAQPISHASASFSARSRLFLRFMEDASNSVNPPRLETGIVNARGACQNNISCVELRRAEGVTTASLWHSQQCVRAEQQSRLDLGACEFSRHVNTVATQTSKELEQRVSIQKQNTNDRKNLHKKRTEYDTLYCTPGLGLGPRSPTSQRANKR